MRLRKEVGRKASAFKNTAMSEGGRKEVGRKRRKDWMLSVSEGPRYSHDSAQNLAVVLFAWCLICTASLTSISMVDIGSFWGNDANLRMCTWLAVPLLMFLFGYRKLLRNTLPWLNRWHVQWLYLRVYIHHADYVWSCSTAVQIVFSFPFSTFWPVSRHPSYHNFLIFIMLLNIVLWVLLESWGISTARHTTSHVRWARICDFPRSCCMDALTLISQQIWSRWTP